MRRIASTRWLRALPLALLLSLAALAAPPGSRADVAPEELEQPIREQDAAASRSASFQAVTGAQGEDVPGGPLLVLAYGAVLTLVLLYVLRLGRLSAGASRDLDRLEKALEGKLDALSPDTAGAEGATPRATPAKEP